MEQNLKKSGQKLRKKFARFSRKASLESKEHIQENLIDRFSHIRNVRLLILEWALLVAVVIFLSITQSFWYSASYAAETYSAGGTYTEATLGQVKTLNPLFASTDSEETLTRLMFADLTQNDYSGHINMELAKSIVPDESGSNWTLQLKDGLKWSDGEPITNADVLYTIGVIKSAGVNTNYTSNFAGVEVTENENGIVFALPSANAYFLRSLNIPILPKHVLENVEAAKLSESPYSTKPTVTSGAFSFNASQNIGTKGESITYLVPNPNYYKGRTLLDNFAVHAYMERDDIIAAVNAGTVTGTAEIGTGMSAQITNKAFSERQSALDYGVYAFLNLDSQTLSDRSIRQAIRQGIDMTAVRSGLDGESALDYPFTARQIDTIEYPALPARDEAAAKQTIAAWNLSDPEAKPLRVVTVNSGHMKEVAEKFTEQLNLLGLRAEMVAFEPSKDFALNTLAPRNYDILIYQIGLGNDPDVFSYYHSSQASSSGLNFSNYKDTISSSLVLSARSIMDDELRSLKYRDFLARWINDVPAIGIYQTNMAYYVNDGVRAFSSEDRFVSETDRLNDVGRWSVEKKTKNRTP